MEVTVKVNNTLEEVDKILLKQGYKIIRRSIIKDEYLTNKKLKLIKRNILPLLNNSVLIRYLNQDGIETKKITYKNKLYDNNQNVLYEEKTSVKIDNIEDAINLFNKLNYRHLVTVKYNAIVYSNGINEYCIQEVDNLGILLEYESLKDYTNIKEKEIIHEKEILVSEIKQTGLSITYKSDIKKAYELLMKEI